jgi:hypothetical protein
MKHLNPNSRDDRTESDIPWTVELAAAETRCDFPISRKAQVADSKPRYALLSQM